MLMLLIVAMIDVPLQTFLHKSRLKMSHQEVKQEHKESDGNPQMKGRHAPAPARHCRSATASPPCPRPTSW
jgi:flagellar biosynthesis protein FlhB